MSHIFDAEYWRSRAEECLTKSEDMRVKEARDALRHLAATYEGMAERASLRHVRPDNDLGRRMGNEK